MIEKDIDKFLKAKKEQLAIDILMFCSLATISSLILLEAMSIEHDHTILLAIFSMIFLMSAMGSSRWVTISRSDLLDIIRRQIDSDAEALVTIAEKRKQNS